MINVRSTLLVQVGATTFSRGLDYWQRDKVVNVKPSGQGLSALVVGSSLGDVYQVNFSKDLKNSLCTCPVGTNCKHFVAAALRAETEGLLQADEPISSAFSSALSPSFSQPKPSSAFEMWAGQRVLPKQVNTDGQQADSIICYVISEKFNEWSLNLYERKRLKNGNWSKGSKLSLSRFDRMSYGEMNTEDKAVLKAMELGHWYPSGNSIVLENAAGNQALLKALKTDRCYFHQISEEPLFFDGESKPLRFVWTETAPFTLSLFVDDDEIKQSDLLLDMSVPLLISSQTNAASFVQTELDVSLINALLNLPTLNKEELQQFVLWLYQRNLSLPLPEAANIKTVDAPLSSTLKVYHDGYDFYAKLHHTYGDFEFLAGTYPYTSQEFQIIQHEDGLLNLHRDESGEQRIQALIEYELGLFAHRPTQASLVSVFRSSLPTDWTLFSNLALDKFEEQGLRIEICTDHPFPQFIEVDEWQGEIDSDEYGDWFTLGLNIDVGGKEVNIVSLLHKVLPQLSNDMDHLPDPILMDYDNNILSIPADAVRPIVKLLQQLGDDSGRIPRHHASVLDDIPYVSRWAGGEKIRELADKLANFDGIETIEAPKRLNAQLRAYQQQGLNWLNFLQNFGFGGILADDMGLGKTIQALAMMQVLFEQKALHKPVLVICPTSLVGNWFKEAEKFTPSLKVLILHGADRKKHFEHIANYNLVISTYPLINRDLEELEKHHFQWLILDEAQVIKNPKAKMTQNVKRLNSEHKLCLTGTPLENHLGELWSLFDFLMPGYLNTNKTFNELYRKPIEQGEQYSQQWLNSRIKPFLLRRTKDQVAKELPAKTEIIQTLELGKEQRKLYESIRVTMEAKVRALLREKGIAKSQIEFLDALLKIRQACCHPQLVKLDEAKKINASVKLEFLLETLPEMLEEGRKVLIFSQFSSMLNIIEKALEQNGIASTKLTGQTRKRQEAIDKFTEGSVSVFLISLKAGGVGLNLTAADTVIHFDPWWNPAAENQATDRAYRIGQDKPVFVYKLVTQNTIEERVLELQRKKANMAQAIYGDKQEQVNELSNMNSEQLLALFE